MSPHHLSWEQCWVWLALASSSAMPSTDGRWRSTSMETWLKKWNCRLIEFMDCQNSDTRKKLLHLTTLLNIYIFYLPSLIDNVTHKEQTFTWNIYTHFAHVISQKRNKWVQDFDFKIGWCHLWSSSMTVNCGYRVLKEWEIYCRTRKDILNIWWYEKTSSILTLMKKTQRKIWKITMKRDEEKKLFNLCNLMNL